MVMHDEVGDGRAEGGEGEESDEDAYSPCSDTFHAICLFLYVSTY